jgi:hypothetical protein
VLCTSSISEDFVLYSENLPTVGRVTPKIIPLFKIERKYTQCIALKVLMSLIWTVGLTAQHAARSLGIIFQNGSSNLCGYRFVKQEIFYISPLLYSVLYNQSVMQNVINSLL